MSAVPAQMSADELALRLNQQALVAGFGLFALDAGPLQRLLDEACRIASEGLQIRLSKVLRHRPTLKDFLVVAGTGWHAGVVGHSTLGSGMDSPAGYAMHTGLPTLSNHLTQEGRFRVPALLAEHGVQSALNVVIGRPDQAPFGVLEVDSTHRHEFVDADTAFLQALANVLAAGLARVEAERAAELLLSDKDLLIREVHHRVANSLQLVRTMLALQSRGTSAETQEQLESAAGRIMSIAAVHRRLYQAGSVIEADIGVYLQTLLDDMKALLADPVGERSIVLEAETQLLSCDSLTSVGLIVSELVTNAIKHGAGRVTVQVMPRLTGLQVVVTDQGQGFSPAQQNEGRRGLGMRLIRSLAKGDPAQSVLVDETAPGGRVVVNITL